MNSSQQRSGKKYASPEGLWLKLSQPKLKLENSLTIFIHALRRIHLLLNFNLQRKRFMKCQQTL